MAEWAIDVDVWISVEYNPDVEKIYQRFQKGKELTDAEIGMLVREGKLDKEDMDDLRESDGGFPGIFVGTKLESDE